MGKYFLYFLIAGFAFAAHAQPYTQSTVEKLDQLEQERIVLTKEIEVTKLQAELQKANAAVGVTTGANTHGSPLSLIKINGLASNPEAVFLYGGYRVVSHKGSMVIPNLQIVSVSQSYVVLKDITTGKESVLWLSAEDTTSSTSNTTTTTHNTR